MHRSLLLLLLAGTAAITAALPSAADAGGVTTTAASVERSAATRFVSTKYGYTLSLPSGWGGIAATTTFPGGDIDHTASYADSITAPEERSVFVLGRPTKATVDDFARAHSAWLVANRPCRSLGAPRPATLAGTPARIARFTCREGVYGATFVLKWVTTRRSRGLIVTQFTPEGHRAADQAALARLLASFAWR